VAGPWKRLKCLLGRSDRQFVDANKNDKEKNAMMAQAIYRWAITDRAADDCMGLSPTRDIRHRSKVSSVG
jgi:hypothetical protein